MRKLIVILAFVAFWFEGSELCWVFENGTQGKRGFEIGWSNPNDSPIHRIDVTENRVNVYAGRYMWKVIYGKDEKTSDHWWVSHAMNGDN